MSRFPQQPLDAEERALAAALPRLHGRSEPDAVLDARILAAAHAAALAPPPSPRWRRWPAPLALTASLCLAVGLAWQLREPAPPHAADEAKAESTAPATAFATAAPADDATAAAASAAKRSIPTATSTVQAAPADTARAAPKASVASRPEAPPPAAVAALPPPPPPPPPPPSPAAPPAAAAMAESAAIQAAPADVGPPAAARTLALPAAMARARSAEPAERALETQDAPDEDVPPATASSPEVRDAWLRRIGELMREGRLDEARASLAEFRRRYPETKLPAELRGLEPASR